MVHTEQVLQVLLNTSTKIDVIRQNESNFIMRRESNIISNGKIKKVLATADFENICQKNSIRNNK